MTAIDERDYQYLLCRYYYYLEDECYFKDPWDCDDFRKYAEKYGYTRNNLFFGMGID